VRVNDVEIFVGEYLQESIRIQNMTVSTAHPKIWLGKSKPENQNEMGECGCLLCVSGLKNCNITKTTPETNHT